MSPRADAFRRDYLGDALPLELSPTWRIVDVAVDRVRRAFDLVAAGPGEARLTIFVERRAEGTPFLAETAHLHLSYYPDTDVDERTAAGVVRAAAAVLGAREARLDGDAVAALFGPHGGESPTGARAVEVRINRECNEACVFCNTPADSEAIVERGAIRRTIEGERAAGFTEITITGREPTLDPDLVDYVRLAREVGYRVIRVQTNGTAFAAPAVLDRLVTAGMTAAEVSLHTTDPAVFRTLVGAAPKLLDKTLAGLRNLASYPTVTTTLVVVLTRFNLDTAAAMIAYVGTRLPHVAAITLSPMAPVGDGARRLDAVPRMAELTPALADIFDAADAHGLRVAIPPRCGAPLCVTPERYRDRNEDLRNTPGVAVGAAKAKPAGCRACVHDAICGGVWKSYLDAYGDGELVPVRT